MARSKKPPRRTRPAATKPVRLYTFDVSLVRGTRNDQVPVASRTIQLRGDQTLEQLHQAVALAFNLPGDFSYEFQFDAGPLHPEGRRYVVPAEFSVDAEGGNTPAGRVTDTVLDDLGLRANQSFGYWPDAGDDWWNKITVQRVKQGVPKGKYPKVTKRIGKGPFGLGKARQQSRSDFGKDEGADTACLVGEVHLKKGEYQKAIEAFTRAIESRPTADAYEGRAKAYRALAAVDEREAEGLK